MSAALEELLEKIHTAALVRGEAWLREKVAEIIAEEGSQDPPPCAKRGRALERRSPSPVPKIQRKNPLEVSGGPCPASEGPCPAKNPFSVGSDSRDGDKGLRIPVNAASQRGSDSEPSSSAENQKSSSSKSGQQCFSPSPNLRTVKAETCDSDSNRKVPGTTQSSNAEESIEFRIDRLLQSCSAAIELQQEEDERSEPTPAPVSSSVPGVRPVVWLIGHTNVYMAEKRATFRPVGRTLGFTEADLHWRGYRGLRWPEVLPIILSVSRRDPSVPTVLVVHAGGNDLGLIRKTFLLRLILSDIDQFLSFFKNVVLVWSEMIPRTYWHGARNTQAMEKVRKLLNRRISEFVTSRQGVVVKHRQLEGDNHAFLLDNGVHLNDLGMDIFLSGLQDGIGKALSMLLVRRIMA
ncbi:uncharacterized protein ACNLHF_028401 isoform 5-T5 [Anomaloglossus baeobatrachus]